MVTETREGVGADFDNFWDWVQTRPRGTFAATFAIFAIFVIFAFFRCTFDVRFDTLGASIFTPGVPKWLFINLAEGTYKGQLTQQPIISFNLWVTSNYLISLVKNDWPPSPNLRFSRVKPRGLLVQRRSPFVLSTWHGGLWKRLLHKKQRHITKKPSKIAAHTYSEHIQYTDESRKAMKV